MGSTEPASVFTAIPTMPPTESSINLSTLSGSTFSLSSTSAIFKRTIPSFSAFRNEKCAVSGTTMCFLPETCLSMYAPSTFASEPPLVNVPMMFGSLSRSPNAAMTSLSSRAAPSKIMESERVDERYMETTLSDIGCGVVIIVPSIVPSSVLGSFSLILNISLRTASRGRPISGNILLTLEVLTKSCIYKVYYCPYGVSYILWSRPHKHVNHIRGSC